MAQNKWIQHYLKMVKHELPHEKYYIIPDTTQKGEGVDIQLVAPTQMAVAQAKMAVKRKMETISNNQKGGAVKKRKINPTVKKSKKSIPVKKTKIKSTVKKSKKPTKRKKTPKSKKITTNKGKGKKIGKLEKNTIKGVRKGKKIQSNSRRSTVKISQKKIPTLKYF